MNAKRFSGKIGEEYDIFVTVCPHFYELQQGIADQVSRAFSRRKMSRIQVLELGCGPGFTTQRLLDADKRINVVAVDNEKKMLQQAKTYLSSALAKKRVRLELSDAYEFLRKQPTDFYDAFASGFTLHNFAHPYRHDVLRKYFEYSNQEEFL